MVGLLGQIVGGMVAGQLGRRARRRGGGSMVVNGLLVALAVKAARRYMRQRGQDRSFAPGQAAGTDTARGRLAGGAGGGGGLGAILGGLGGAGALGALLNHLRQSGLGAEVESWIRPGPNTPVPPQKLAASLGEDTIESLAEETGLPRDELLSELSLALPEAVDELTPEGRVPQDEEMDRLAGSA